MDIKKGLPPEAKQVFKGILFSVYQWPQTLFDGSIATFERLKRPDTVQVIATIDNKVLMQEEKQPGWETAVPSIPGGRLDENEDPLYAIKRELEEETGYQSTDWILWKSIRPVFKIDWTIYTFIARNCTITSSQKLDTGGEDITTRLVSFEEFMHIATEDSQFYSPEIVPDLLRLRLYPEKLHEFHTLLFSK